MQSELSGLFCCCDVLSFLGAFLITDNFDISCIPDLNHVCF